MSGRDEATAREERLFRLSEELVDALAAGESIDSEAWARRFDVPIEDVQRVRRALEWLEEPPDEPDVAPVEIPRPELPDDYELLEELGRGGMGIVYRARQKSLAREVALKVLLPGELVFGEALARFRREAKSLARLRHRHIVSIHDVGEHAGRVFFTMDLIDGAPLSRLVAEDELTVARSVRLVRQVASAIAYVHQRGLLHRDLKPQNVLVDEEGDAFVVDFGLARDDAGHADSLTGSGRILGTPAYMAPEQARGDRAHIGEATDVYAMGAVLYECLTGRAPFAGLSIAETIHAVLHREPTPMRKLDPRIPPPLEWIVMRAMAKDPAERYPTAQALQEDLERFEEGRTVRAEPPSLARRARAFVRRERKVVLAVLVTLLLAGASFQALIRPRLGPSRDALLRVAQELEARGEQEAADALVGRLLTDARGDLATFRSWVLARLKRAEALRATNGSDAARELVAEVAAALRERRASLGEGDPLSDAERLALDALTVRAVAAEGEPFELLGFGSRDFSAKRPPAFSAVWRWVDPEALAAVPSSPLVHDSLRWFAAEIFGELADPDQATAATLSIAATILGEHPGTRAWLERDPSHFESVLAAAARIGDDLTPELAALVGPEPGGVIRESEHAATLSGARWIELCAADARDGSAIAARWLAWAADLPPGTDDVETAVAVLSAAGLEAERRRRDVARTSLLEGDPDQDLRVWLGTRHLAATSFPDDPVAALAAALGVRDVRDDRRALLAAFDEARRNDRRAFHVLLTLLDDAPDAPRWPGLGSTEPEPVGLATSWHLRWGDRAHEGWQIRIGRFERAGWRAPLRLTSWSVLIPEADGKFVYQAELPVENERAHGYGLDRRAFLGRASGLKTRAASDTAHLEVVGRLGWSAGGFAARVARPSLRQGSLASQLIATAPFNAELEPDTPSILARVREPLFPRMREWPAREVLIVARLERAGGKDAEWTRPDWDADLLATIERSASSLRTVQSRGRERLVGDKRHVFEEAVSLAAELALPDAIPIFRDIARRNPLTLTETDLAAARLAAGDGSGASDTVTTQSAEWYARLWLDAEVEQVRERARAGLVPLDVPGPVRLEIADVLRERGEEIPDEFTSHLVESASRSRQMRALVIVGWIFGLIAGLGVVLGIGSAVRSGKLQLDPRKWRWDLLRGDAGTMMLLAIPAFGRFPGTILDYALLPVGLGFAVLAALGRDTIRSWVPAALFLLAAPGLFLEDPCWAGGATVLYDLAGLAIVPCLFRRWTIQSRSPWRHVIWAVYLFSVWPLITRLLSTVSLWLETCGEAGGRLAGLKLYAFVESFGAADLQTNPFWLFWLFQLAHNPSWVRQAGGARATAPRPSASTPPRT